ncbi:putative ABC transporter ATP-binding protein [Acaryochloris thomasi RCC1774]|uniref:Putative ABC transporter ATP-binding protein n=1 Tax=Acaryochloris thomasi RCC1774 TaxID=1764569 RepID=A0A2W1JFC7_9CYAN|nr:ABC transporter ATP-binding protein [Acaryochloris thomasi]PZD72369.1 putative ABC transporter ATP-binding protein [Acaryochloris thomasi RCC1774]
MTAAADLTPSKSRSPGNDWRLLGYLIPYAKRHRRKLLWVALLLVPLSVAGAVQPILIGQAISFIRDEPSTFAWLRDRNLTEGLDLLSLTLLLTVTVQFSLQGIQGFMVQKVGQQMTNDIRNDLFAHVQSLASSFFERTPVGKLITRITNDVEALGDVFSTGAVGIITDMITILVLVIVMFLRQWKLALVLVLLLVPIAGVIIYFQNQYRAANYKSREQLSNLNANLQENITGIGVVQLFRREQYNARLFRQINERYITAVDRTIFFDSAVSATLEWTSLVGIAGVLLIGGQAVLGESLDIGTLTEFILFAQRLFNPLQQLAEKFTTLQGGFTAIERITDLMQEPIEIGDPQYPKMLPLADGKTALGEVKFSDVWLAYKSDDYVLKALDFTIKPGEKIAIVGPTGAGKSSLIRLLSRLYEATKGQVLVDGVDVRDLSQAELRQHVGVILQDGFLFAGDVKGNIALGEDYSFEQIQEAAVQMNVASFIEQLPEGYDTALRERGTNLSGGQKQLLAFARAAIRNPRILVLDEATANLDVGTEAMIQEALDRLLVDRTAIIIAHRLSTIRNVDRILVLNHGQLAEFGTHDELMRSGGLYASLYQLQMLGQGVEAI